MTGRGAQGFDRTPFATFDRRNEDSVPLWAGYRDHVKSRWRGAFWPVAVLLELDARAALSPGLRQLADDVRRARTLPLPLGQVAGDVRIEAERHPAIITRTNTWDSDLACMRMSVVPSEEHVGRRVEAYRNLARRVLVAMGRDPMSAVGMRVLEQGCGTGTATLAFASFGAEAVGVDVGREGDDTERSVATRAFFGSSGPFVRFEQADAECLPYPDGTFDLVHSASVLEHVSDARAAISEAFRVLKPGGWAYFDVDPWFGPAGGHSLCTLDFPWGHVRLDAEEFAPYLGRHRPHERDEALKCFSLGFQSPRLTIGETRQAITETGFEVRGWAEAPTPLDTHHDLLTQVVLEDARKQHPAVTPRDLMTGGLTMVLSKP
ncbi:MAG: class I SAM-dependent methyltransferase [Acidobacteriota bacterium]